MTNTSGYTPIQHPYEAATPHLVRRYAHLKVQDAIHEYGITTAQHTELRDIVTELRSRSVLD